MKIISENNPRITFSDTAEFVNHSVTNRSGHLSHALVECMDGSILAFYSNCSAEHLFLGRVPGHTMFGWVEYKRSTDRGLTWSEPKVLDYSYKEFLNGNYRIGCEKAVVCDDGTIVLFCLRSIGEFFEPYTTPTCIVSRDSGETWSEPVEVHNEAGRIYDVIYRDGRIYALEFCFDCKTSFTCDEKGKYYKLIVSDDNGKTFRVLSTIPFDTEGHAYGNLIFRQDNSLVFYGYNINDTENMTCLISEDLGKSWGKPFKSYVSKMARNPQVEYLNGYYICHARYDGEWEEFAVYYSKDGINWSDGVIVSDYFENGIGHDGCYYSNSLPVKGKDGVTRLLVQYSETYVPKTAKATVMHAWIECKTV